MRIVLTSARWNKQALIAIQGYQQRTSRVRWSRCRAYSGLHDAYSRVYPGDDGCCQHEHGSDFNGVEQAGAHGNHGQPVAAADVASRTMISSLDQIVRSLVDISCRRRAPR